MAPILCLHCQSCWSKRVLDEARSQCQVHLLRNLQQLWETLNAAHMHHEHALLLLPSSVSPSPSAPTSCDVLALGSVKEIASTWTILAWSQDISILPSAFSRQVTDDLPSSNRNRFNELSTVEIYALFSNELIGLRHAQPLMCGRERQARACFACGWLVGCQ